MRAYISARNFRDAEITALETCYDTLRGFDAPTRDRIICWLNARLESDSRAPVASKIEESEACTHSITFNDKEALTGTCGVCGPVEFHEHDFTWRKVSK